MRGLTVFPEMGAPEPGLSGAPCFALEARQESRQMLVGICRFPGIAALLVVPSRSRLATNRWGRAFRGQGKPVPSVSNGAL
jgi:hypothetical protein